MDFVSSKKNKEEDIIFCQYFQKFFSMSRWLRKRENFEKCH